MISVVLIRKVQTKAGLQVIKIDYDACPLADGLQFPYFLCRLQRSYNFVALGVFIRIVVYCCCYDQIMLILITE